VIRTYPYRLYPNQGQEAVLGEILDVVRWLYNHALDYRRKRWNESRYSVSYNEQSAMWRDWRNEAGLPDEGNALRLLNMSAGQQVLRRLDQAYRESLAGKRGKPKFKGWRFFNSLSYKPGDVAIIDSPQWLKQSLQRVKRLQRRVARRKKGSAGREEAIQQLAKEHEHIANQRRDWWHKVVYWLVATYGVVVLEDLRLAFMLRNGNLARAAHDVSLGLFYEILSYKAIEAGVQIVKVDPRNTSQQCSGCPEIVPKDLSVRVHTCPHCGLTLDRDVNAALNILGIGLEKAVRR
jgi:IS605 OrfB family transposase